MRINESLQFPIQPSDGKEQTRMPQASFKDADCNKTNTEGTPSNAAGHRSAGHDGFCDGCEHLASLVRKTVHDRSKDLEFPVELFEDAPSFYHPLGPDATQFIDLNEVRKIKEHGGLKPSDALEFPVDVIKSKWDSDSLEFPGEVIARNDGERNDGDSLKFPDFEE